MEKVRKNQKQSPFAFTVKAVPRFCGKHISNFYCEGEQTPFLVGVALFTVSVQNSEYFMSVCRHVSIFHAKYRQLQESASNQSNRKVFSAAPKIHPCK